jgi:hypothetical protein
MDKHRQKTIWDTYQMVKSTIEEYHAIALDPKLDADAIKTQLELKWGTEMGIRKVLMACSVALRSIQEHEQDLTPFLKSYGRWLYESVEYIISPNEQPPLPIGLNDQKSGYDYQVPGDYRGDWAYCCWSFYETYEEYMYCEGEYES